MIRTRHHHGFSLIEIMVGLVIGLIATIIIFQVFSLSERQKRTTTGTSDAQGNGAIAIATLARDVKAAGWGLQHSNFRCLNIFTFDSTMGGALDSHGSTSLLQSASIVDGGAADSDSVSILMYGNPSNPQYELGVGTLTSSMANAGVPLEMTSTSGCSVGSVAVIGDNANCSLMQVTGLTSTTLTHDAGARYNSPDLTGWPTYSPNIAGNSVTVQCFPMLFRRTFQIANEQLEVVDQGVAAPIATGIVDFQAEYGIRDTTVSPPIRWVSAAAAPWVTPTIANVRQIEAIRIALLARNSEYQKPGEGSTECDATTDAMAATWSAWASFNTAGYPADWHCYRYKAFETVIPLRNVIWAKF